VDADTCAEESVVADVELCTVAETSGTDVAAFDTRSLFVAACDVILCAVVITPAVAAAGCVAGESDDVTSFCAVVETCTELATVLDVGILDDVVCS